MMLHGAGHEEFHGDASESKADLRISIYLYNYTNTSRTKTSSHSNGLPGPLVPSLPTYTGCARMMSRRTRRRPHPAMGCRASPSCLASHPCSTSCVWSYEDLGKRMNTTPGWQGWHLRIGKSHRYEIQCNKKKHGSARYVLARWPDAHVSPYTDSSIQDSCNERLKVTLTTPSNSFKF